MIGTFGSYISWRNLDLQQCLFSRGIPTVNYMIWNDGATVSAPCQECQGCLTTFKSCSGAGCEQEFPKG